jgi:preprotein translocase subunit SecY
LKTLESIVRKVFFYGAFVIALVALLEKISNQFHTRLLGGAYTPNELLILAAIALIFSIAMQLHQIRLLLSSKGNDQLK